MAHLRRTSYTCQTRSLTVQLPDDLGEYLAKTARDEGHSEGEIAAEILRKGPAARHLVDLRRKVIASLGETAETGEAIFERLS